MCFFSHLQNAFTEITVVSKRDISYMPDNVDFNRTITVIGR